MMLYEGGGSSLRRSIPALVSRAVEAHVEGARKHAARASTSRGMLARNREGAIQKIKNLSAGTRRESVQKVENFRKNRPQEGPSAVGLQTHHRDLPWPNSVVVENLFCKLRMDRWMSAFSRWLIRARIREVVRSGRHSALRRTDLRERCLGFCPDGTAGTTVHGGNRDVIPSRLLGAVRGSD
jgi:hypothetical protein